MELHRSASLQLLDGRFAQLHILTFLFLALVTLALIFRDAFRRLNADDQTTFRRWMGRKLSLKTRAIDND
jgi:hypothetical protein